MDLLELPLWMTLKRAVCNHVSLKVQWMKLKTVPIYLALDEVVVEMETCEEFRQDSKAKSNLASYASVDDRTYCSPYLFLLSINPVNRENTVSGIEWSTDCR